MGSSSPFQVLLDYDQRCRVNARGLPKGPVVEKDWVGIGFSLGGKKLVAKMSDVTEILPIPATVRVPGVQSWVRGIANIRGNLLPVLDMKAYLTGAFSDSAKERRILVINKQNVVAGLLVEEVFGMRRFKPDLLKEPATQDMGALEPYLEGVFNDAQFQWRVFSMEKLVTHEKFLRLV